MVKKKKDTETPLANELESAKMEMVRIRFRRVLGESIPAHVIKNARKNIAKCVRLHHCNGEKDA